MSLSQPLVRRTYERRKHLFRLRLEMHTRDCYIDQDEAAPSYERAFASLIIGIANITSGPASTRPPGRWGAADEGSEQLLEEASIAGRDRREEFVLRLLREVAGLP
jgi:hypothetical protein